MRWRIERELGGNRPVSRCGLYRRSGWRNLLAACGGGLILLLTLVDFQPQQKHSKFLEDMSKRGSGLYLVSLLQGHRLL